MGMNPSCALSSLDGKVIRILPLILPAALPYTSAKFSTKLRRGPKIQKPNVFLRFLLGYSQGPLVLESDDFSSCRMEISYVYRGMHNAGNKRILALDKVLPS
ncbi:unnamed protein product [Albugo candida]|uniref:Uncharacterized protein n=1 Tax=Albugo candida TaxID=65357 RepID=A0A024G4Z5_9STRA|nr:unnamed protein product [Albugo candida]|eukprot:CCI41752.1 unnamed protein product [Albugo candida]